MKKIVPVWIWATIAFVAAGAVVFVGASKYASLNRVSLSASDIPESLRSGSLIAQNEPANTGVGGSPVVGKATDATAATPAPDNGDYAKISKITELLLTKENYLHHPMDNTISERLFDRFLNDLDPQHLYFLQSDLDEWAPLRDQVGPMIAANGDASFAQTAFARFKQRYAAQKDFVDDALKTRQFTFTGNEMYSLDRKDAGRPKDLDAAKDLWWQRLRFEYLEEKLNHKKPDEIIKTLSRRYSRLQKSFQEEDADEIFELYVTTLCEAFDPHSDYFGKASTANFAIQMQLSLAGIGAELRSVDGYVTIEGLIPGGPAILSHKLKVRDRIVSVSQGASGGDPVETTDMNLDKVVDMIRGKKGTIVRLVVWPAAAPDPSTRVTVTLTRDVVHLANKGAHSELIELPSVGGKSTRIGVIALPSFYGGPAAPQHATEDVALLIKKLKSEHVTGIILDLRGNPGGILDEAAGVAGLFVKQGPMVQSRYADGKVEVKNDPDPGIAWDGPLVVMTSRLSASAAEIVTGALRDYGRAVIVGDTNTFGKSTVQDQVPLSEVMQQVNLQTVSDPGSIHLTIAKYYLPSGHSVQLNGVPSDIVLPSPTDVLEVGEKFLKNPLPSDSIPSASFDKTNRVQPFVGDLQRRAKDRIAKNPDFAYLEDEITRLKKTINDKSVSLNEAKRETERKDAVARVAARKKLLASRKAPKETIYEIALADAAKPGLPAALKGAVVPPVDPAASEDDDLTLPTDTTGPVERDLSLDETKRILLDYIALSHK